MHLKTNLSGHFISTTFTRDHGWETMVFAIKEDDSIDWTDLDVDHYESEVEAREGHERMVAKWSKGQP